MSRIVVEDGDLYLGEHVESGFLVIVGHCMLLFSSLLVSGVMSMSWGRKVSSVVDEKTVRSPGSIE